MIIKLNAKNRNEKHRRWECHLFVTYKLKMNESGDRIEVPISLSSSFSDQSVVTSALLRGLTRY